jgi:hypothetical protein
MDAVHLFWSMLSTGSNGMPSSFPGAPESVVALVWNQWTACSGIHEGKTDPIRSGAG